MSASSFWVTCGIIAQLRARLAPDELLDARAAACVSTCAELGEVHLRPRDQVEAATAAAGRRAGRAAGERRLHEAPARPPCRCGRRAALPRDLRQVDAEFAREQAHGRTGVRHLAGHQAVGIEATGERRRRRGARRGSGAGCGGGLARAAGAARPASRGLGFRAPGAGGGAAPRRRRAWLRPAPRAAAASAVRSSPPRRRSASSSPILTLQLAHDAGEWRRHFHRRLVRFQRDQSLVLARRCRRPATSSSITGTPSSPPISGTRASLSSAILHLRFRLSGYCGPIGAEGQPI